VLALATAEAFFGAGGNLSLDIDAVRDAFATVTVPGRLERVRTAPSVFLDGAHNPHGAQALASALREEFAFRRLVAVVGVMRDKDARGILAELEPVVDEVVLTGIGSPRAMGIDDLTAAAQEIFDVSRWRAEARLPDAIKVAIDSASDATDPDPAGVSGVGVIITGSVAMVGAARTLFGRDPQ